MPLNVSFFVREGGVVGLLGRMGLNCKRGDIDAIRVPTLIISKYKFKNIAVKKCRL